MKEMVLTITLALPVLLMGASPGVAVGDAMINQQYLIDFGDTDRSRWYVINDGVMGGVSQSALEITQRKTALFTGDLSLENNGGFASVRAAIGSHDLSPYEGLELRVRGDGRTYQLWLRTNEDFDGIAYRAFFETRDNEWITTSIPFEQFVPSFRGRTIADAPPLDPSQIRQVAFMLSDKQPGSFALEIDFVRTTKTGRMEP